MSADVERDGSSVSVEGAELSVVGRLVGSSTSSTSSSPAIPLRAGEATSASSEDDDSESESCEQPPQRYFSNMLVQPFPSSVRTRPARTPDAVGPVGSSKSVARPCRRDRKLVRTLLTAHDDDVVRVPLRQRKLRHLPLLLVSRRSTRALPAQERANLRAPTTLPPPLPRPSRLPPRLSPPDSFQRAQEVAQVAVGLGKGRGHIERADADLERGSLCGCVCSSERAGEGGSARAGARARGRCG